MNIILTCTTSFFLGKYVPAVSYTIHTKNPTAKQRINLKGRNNTGLICLNMLYRKTVDLHVFYFVKCNAFSFVCDILNEESAIQFSLDTLVVWRTGAHNLKLLE
jgi:hypothetical protein